MEDPTVAVRWTVQIHSIHADSPAIVPPNSRGCQAWSEISRHRTSAAGQDMRTLALDGCPSTNMYAIEKMSGFVDAGYEFWQDKDTLKTRFIIGDFLDRSLLTVEGLTGRWALLMLVLSCTFSSSRGRWRHAFADR